MKVLINGQEKEIAADTTLRGLLEGLQLRPEKVAIELNRRLVRTAQYDQALKHGDQIEVVTFVGGG